MGDFPTEFLNEEQILQRLDQEIRLCRSQHGACSLLVIAPDPNPSLGPTWQPKATQSLTDALIERLQSYLADQDVFAHLDRRQYAILLPGKLLQQAYDLAEATRIKVEDSPFPANAVRPRPCKLTISVGVAEWSDDLPANQFLARARNAYEEARSNGNSVWSSAD